MKTFSQRVVEAALAVPKGRVTTYGTIAKACGSGGMAAQSITSILGRAWEAGEKRIPWHRIVYAGGKVWIDDARRKERMALYKKEGIEVDPKTGKIKHFDDIFFSFK